MENETKTPPAPLTNETDREQRDRILSALLTFAQQKPRLEFGNYGDPVAYRAEVRRITRDLHYARRLLATIHRTEQITAAALVEAFGSNGYRLTWDGSQLDYTTGQYWPTEYRPAVCQLAACALWNYYRDYCSGGSPTGTTIAKAARRDFPAAMVKRFF
jgi:hypothetical protein